MNAVLPARTQAHSHYIKQSAALLDVPHAQLDDLVIEIACRHIIKAAASAGRRIVLVTSQVLGIVYREAQTGAYDDDASLMWHRWLSTPKDWREADLVVVVVSNGLHVRISEARVAGSHWSVLFYSPVQNALYHYDSLRNANGNVARHVRDIMRYGGYIDDDTRFYSPAPDVPQQLGVYECGYYAVWFVETMVRLRSDGSAPSARDDFPRGKPLNCELDSNVRAYLRKFCMEYNDLE
jgi:hypothetical protein